jgi:GntR family transcriptional regulator
MCVPDVLLSPAPLYKQVKRILLERIAGGAWRPGELLPAEPRLAVELGVSPGTVRKALDELAHERLVVRQQGRGTFVAEQTPDSALFYFFRLVDEEGRRVVPTSREVAREHGLARPDERARLGLDAGARVVRLVRLRRVDGAGALAERVVVPLVLCPGLEAVEGELPNTLYDLYQKRWGHTVRRADETLSATLTADDPLGRLLELPAGAPVLEIDRIAYTLREQRLEWRLSLVDTRRVRYFTTIE